MQQAPSTVRAALSLPLPAGLPVFTGLRVASAQWPPPGRTGDIVDVHQEPDLSTTFFLGDVAGNGQQAADAAVGVRRLLRRHLHGASSLARAFSRLNDALEQELSAHLFVTAIAARIDARGHTVHVVSAGHLGPVIYRRPHGALPVAIRPGPPLGIVPGQEFQQQSTPGLQRNDTLVFATDGVSDRLATTSDPSGASGLRTALARLPPLGPAAICRDLLRIAAATLNCDATVLAVRLGQGPDGNRRRGKASAHPLRWQPSARNFFRGPADLSSWPWWSLPARSSS